MSAIADLNIEQENMLLRHVIEHAAECILIVDRQGIVKLANESAGRAFGYGAEELTGMSLEALFPRDKLRGSADELMDALCSGGSWSGEITARRKDGYPFPVHAAVAFQPEVDGGRGIIYARDVTEQQRLLDRLKQMSITDELTGAYNARYLWARLRYELLRAQRYRQPLSCVMADLDRFKLVNDMHGHRTGDEVLRLTVQRIQQVTRQSDIVARYGGEEFAVILPVTPVHGAAQCAEHIRRAVEASPMTVGTLSLKITMSLGVAEAGPDVEDEESLMRRADQALMQAKKEGRNRVCIWTPQATMQPIALVGQEAR